MIRLNNRFFCFVVVLILILLNSFSAYAQKNAIVFGNVTDDKGRPLEPVNISVMGTPGGTS